MQPSRYLLIGLGAGLAAGGALYLQHSSRPAASRSPNPGLAAPPAPAQGVRLPPPVPLAPAYPPQFASVHEALRQLREVQTGDDAAEARVLADLESRLTDANVAEILPGLSREELRTAFGTEALRRWLQLDPLAAAGWIAGRPDATAGDAALVARQLLANPAGLNATSDQLPEGQFRQDLLLEAGREAIARDPAEAASLAQRLGPGPAQTNLLETVAYAWTTKDPDAALAWMMTVTDPALHESLVAMGAKAIAVTDPEMAADWLAEGVKSPELFKATALALAETWAVRSPTDAAAWVSQLPPGESRQAAVNVILRHWLASDPEAAHAWILTLPEKEGILQALRVAQTAPDAPPSDP